MYWRLVGDKAPKNAIGTHRRQAGRTSNGKWLLKITFEVRRGKDYALPAPPSYNLCRLLENAFSLDSDPLEALTEILRLAGRQKWWLNYHDENNTIARIQTSGDSF